MGLIILCVSLVYFGVTMIPGIYDSNFKWVMNILLELYTCMVACSFLLLAFFDDTSDK